MAPAPASAAAKAAESRRKSRRLSQFMDRLPWVNGCESATWVVGIMPVVECSRATGGDQSVTCWISLHLHFLKKSAPENSGFPGVFQPSPVCGEPHRASKRAFREMTFAFPRVSQAPSVVFSESAACTEGNAIVFTPKALHATAPGRRGPRR